MLEYKQKRNNGRTPFAGVYKFVCVCVCVCVCGGGGGWSSPSPIKTFDLDPLGYLLCEDRTVEWIPPGPCGMVCKLTPG